MAVPVARTQAAPPLYKGFGYLFSRAHAASEASYREPVRVLAGVDGTDDELFDLIRTSLDAMHGGGTRRAVENALGGYPPYQGQSLADRRRSLADQLEVSARTLFRYEARGVEELILHIDRLLEKPPEIRPTVDGLTAARQLELADVVLDKTKSLSRKIKRIERTNKGPETIAKIRDAVEIYLGDFTQEDLRDMSDEAALLVQRYREWREDLDDMYWRLRMQNDR